MQKSCWRFPFFSVLVSLFNDKSTLMGYFMLKPSLFENSTGTTKTHSKDTKWVITFLKSISPNVNSITGVQTCIVQHFSHHSDFLLSCLLQDPLWEIVLIDNPKIFKNFLWFTYSKIETVMIKSSFNNNDKVNNQ